MFKDEIEDFSCKFKNVLLIINNISNNKDIIFNKINNLKIEYNKLLKVNNKKIYLLCLDSFFFQYKYFFTEFEQIDISRKLVLNRMYCEFYKLYKTVLNYIEENKFEYNKENIKVFPTYKDLEPLYEYNLDNITLLFENIILLLTSLNEYLIKNYKNISNYNNEYKIGLSIFNFTNTMQNETVNIENQLKLFMNFLYYFLYSQKIYNEQIYNRYIVLLKNINEITFSEELNHLLPFYKSNNNVSTEVLLNYDLSINDFFIFENPSLIENDISNVSIKED